MGRARLQRELDRSGTGPRVAGDRAEDQPEQLTEPRGRVTTAVDRGDDELGVLLLPSDQGSGDERIAVGEVPVEAALRGPEDLGDGLDGDCCEPPASECLEGGTGPVVDGAAIALSVGHSHTLPYGLTSIRGRMEGSS